MRILLLLLLTACGSSEPAPSQPAPIDVAPQSQASSAAPATERAAEPESDREARDVARMCSLTTTLGVPFVPPIMDAVERVHEVVRTEIATPWIRAAFDPEAEIREMLEFGPRLRARSAELGVADCPFADWAIAAGRVPGGPPADRLGCPDRDRDGVEDCSDACPFVTSGPVDELGCPR